MQTKGWLDIATKPQKEMYMKNKKFIAPVLFALVTLSSVARADSSNVGEFGQQLEQASTRINEILSSAPETGSDDTGTPSTGNEGPVVEEGESGSGSDSDVWGSEDDKKALPIYLKSATALGDAGSSFIQAQVADDMGNYQVATLRKTQACARVNIALADLATANYLASLPGKYMYLKAFGPELTELLKDIKFNRNVYCI